MDEQAIVGLGRRYTTPRGTLSLWRINPLLVLKLEGQGDADFATPIIDAFDAVVGPGLRVEMFVDLGALSNYDSGLRQRCTQHFVKKRAQIGSLNAHFRSRIVAMGVTVANAALGGIMTLHSGRAAFCTKLDAKVKELRIVGFSSANLGPL